MDRRLIEKNAETFEVGARDSMKESNKRIFELGDLMLKVAIGLGGIAATRLIYDPSLMATEYGLYCFGGSIIAGGTQMALDMKFFKKQGKVLIGAADRWKWLSVNTDDIKANIDAQQTVEVLKSVPSSSSLCPILFQGIFLIIGTILLITDII